MATGRLAWEFLHVVINLTSTGIEAENIYL